MKIDKDTEIDLYNKKLKEVMENTEAIIEKIKTQGEKYNKRKVGDVISFKMENGLEVNISPKLTGIGNSSLKKVPYTNPYTGEYYSEDIYSGIYLNVKDEYGFHSVEIQGCKNNCIFFHAEITRDYYGKYELDRGSKYSYLDTDDWSLFDIARRSIEETKEIDRKKKLGGLASKERKIKVLDKFKDKLGVEDLKRSGNGIIRKWLIDGLVNLINKYEFSPEEHIELQKRINEFDKQNNPQPSGSTEEGR